MMELELGDERSVGRYNGNSEILIISNESEIFIIQSDEERRSLRYTQLSEGESHRMVPAEDLFGGRFTEVRNLRNQLACKVKVKLAIVTRKYGLIEGEERITPYLGYVSNTQGICEIEENFALCETIRKMIDACDMAIICLPKNILSFFIRNQVFSKKSKIVFITTEDLAINLKGDYFITMPRRGARVGKDNAQRLLQICDKLDSDL